MFANNALPTLPRPISRLAIVVALGCCQAGCNLRLPVGLSDEPVVIPQSPSTSIGGTIEGLVGSGLVLQTPCGPAAFGSRTSPTGSYSGCAGLAPGTAYDVVILTQPTNPSETCAIANGVGTVGSTNVTNINVSCTINAARFLYVANFGSNDVSAYAVEPASGALTPIAGSPFPAGNGPDAIAVDPTGRFAYVSNQADGTISAYLIDRSSGALRVIAGSPFAAGPAPTAVAVDPSSRHLYVGNGSGGSISAFGIDPSTGALTAIAGSPFDEPLAPSALIVDPLDTFAYVVDGRDGSGSALAIDEATGALIQSDAAPFVAASGSRWLAIDPSDRYLFVVDTSSNGILAYSIQRDSNGINTGALAAVSGSPFATGSTPGALCVDPLDRFVYATDQASDGVSAYALDAASGSLIAIAGSPFAAGSGPSAVSVDPTGSFAYVANGGAQTLSVYAIASDSGALVATSGGPVVAGIGPIAIAISD
jgi:6-phosphogluconolactonase (cycloisomerase 2 family)